MVGQGQFQQCCFDEYDVQFVWCLIGEYVEQVVVLVFVSMVCVVYDEVCGSFDFFQCFVDFLVGVGGIFQILGEGEWVFYVFEVGEKGVDDVLCDVIGIFVGWVECELGDLVEFGSLVDDCDCFVVFVWCVDDCQ